MHISLDSALGRQRRLNSVGESVFQIAPDAAAGYSLRSLTGGDPSVVRVRRESDNGERDFNASGVSSGELVNWVNQQITPPLDLRELTATGRDGPIIEAAAAYSLRNLSDSYAGDVVEVRRSSDGAVRSFTAAEVTDGTLVTWVNTPTNGVFANTGFESFSGASASGFTASNTSSTGFAVSDILNGVNGDIVKVSFDISVNGGSPAISLREALGEGGSGSNPFIITSSGSYTVTLTANNNYVGVGFTEGDFPSEFTVSNFKVVVDGTVSKWYDQSTTSGVPNANHAVQTDAAKQPKIVSGGALVTGGLAFDGVNDRLSFASSVALSSNDFFVTSVLKVLEGDGDSITPVGNASGNRFLISLDYDGNSASMRADDGSFLTEGFSAGEPTGNILATVQRVSNTVTLFHQSSNQTTFNATGESFTLGNLGQIYPTSYSKHLLSEIIVYRTDQSDNRTALEANIGEVYGIAGIPAYDNTVNGFVETWYDQSGNGNDATQLTASNQPKIVDSGTLVTATNGLPAMRVLGNTQSFGLSQNLSFSDFSAFYVVKHQAIGSSISWLGDSGGGDYLRYSGGSYQIRAQGVQTAFIDFDTTISTGDDYLLSAVRAGNTLKFFIDGSAQANTVSSSGTFDVQKLFQRGGNTTQTLNGFAQELILYPSDQTANRPAIEANINNQYDIY